MNGASPAHVLSYFTACFLKLKQSLGCTWSPLSPLQWSQSHILDTQNPLSTKTIKHCYNWYLCTCVENMNSFKKHAVYKTCTQERFCGWSDGLSVLKSLFSAPSRDESATNRSHWQHQCQRRQFSGSAVLCGPSSYNCAVGCSRWWPLNSNNRRGTHAMEKPFNCKLASSEGSHVTSTPLMPVLCWPPAKPPLRLRCRQGRFYK